MPPVVAGINHCAAVHRASPARRHATPCRSSASTPTNPIVAWALETYGVLPYCWSHWVEHFPQMQRLEGEYAGTAQGVAMRYGITTHDMAYEKARVAELEALAATWTAPGAGAVTLADLPPGDEDWGIEVIDIIEAIVENRNQTFVVNAPNDGAIPNLPADAIVEVNTAVNGYGIRPISAGPLPEPLAAHLRGYVDFQQHVVKAALTGDRGRGDARLPARSQHAGPPGARADRRAPGRDAAGERGAGCRSSGRPGSRRTTGARPRPGPGPMGFGP